MEPFSRETLSITSLMATVRLFSRMRQLIQARLQEESWTALVNWSSQTVSLMQANLKMGSNREWDAFTSWMALTVLKALLRTISQLWKQIKCFLSWYRPLLKKKSLTLKPKKTQKQSKRMLLLQKKRKPSMEARKFSWSASPTSNQKKSNSFCELCIKVQTMRTQIHLKRMKKLRKNQPRGQPSLKSLKLGW